eukprot:9664646-Lingulodinium_polyedra.AAC.1
MQDRCLDQGAQRALQHETEDRGALWPALPQAPEHLDDGAQHAAEVRLEQVVHQLRGQGRRQ